MGQQPPEYQPPYPPYGQQQPYPQAVPVAFNPAAPYGVDPATGLPYSEKSKIAAGLMQLLLPLAGIPGVGRLYAGHIGIGLTQLIGYLVSWAFFWLLFWIVIGFVFLPVVFGLWLWSVVDGIVILASASPRDGRGLPMK